MKAIVAQSAGDPDVMKFADVPEPELTPNQVRVQVAFAGVNFIDTYQRSGVYQVEFPRTLGLEGAGTVTEVGSDVEWAKHGDRVAWANTTGSYAEQVVLNGADCYAVPDEVALDTAAALMLQGLTAHYLSTSSFPLAPGHTAMVHAGAGGVGLLLTQLAVARGVRVITTTSSEAKAELSLKAGASDVIRYDQFEDITAELPDAVRDLVGNEGVDVVYDGVGKATFDGSLASLKVRGTLVLFGGASGQVPPFDLQRLSASGSLYVTRPTMKHYLLTPEERARRAGEIFDAVADGSLDVRIGARFQLKQAADAHRALEGRETTGKVLLRAGPA